LKKIKKRILHDKAKLVIEQKISRPGKNYQNSKKA